MRKVDAELAPHDFVVVEVSDGGGGGLGVGVFGETEAFGTPGLAVVHEPEGEDAAGAGEDFCDLFFGEAVGNIADEDDATGGRGKWGRHRSDRVVLG